MAASGIQAPTVKVGVLTAGQPTTGGGGPPTAASHAAAATATGPPMAASHAVAATATGPPMAASHAVAATASGNLAAVATAAGPPTTASHAAAATAAGPQPLVNAELARSVLNRHVGLALRLVRASRTAMVEMVHRLGALRGDAGGAVLSEVHALLEEWCLPFLEPAIQDKDAELCRGILVAMFPGLDLDTEPPRQQ